MSNGGDVSGVVFPLVDGERSTTATGRAVFADAARAIDPDLAARIEAADAWHASYLGHVRRLVEAEVQTAGDPDDVARAGLASAHDRFRFVRDGRAARLSEAVREPTDGRLHTVTIEGSGADAQRELVVPYRGEVLAGAGLRRQLDRWIEQDVVEPSFATTINAVLDHPEWLDLSGRSFLVLGAGAEMGPLEALCAWGAEVIAVDLPRPRVWERVLAAARGGAGRVHVPVHAPASGPLDQGALIKQAGVDLIQELPEITAWIESFGGPFVVGNYVYADGATNVQVSMACDALIERLLEHDEDTSLAFLATPTDVYAVPPEVVEASRRRAGSTPAWQKLTRPLTRGALFEPNFPRTVHTPSGREYGIADVLVAQQGPNYALAKRLHRWRARAARAAGRRVSINVAPATSTRSVTKNRVLAAAYRGAHHFGVEVFEPETSDRLMAAALVHDLHTTDGVSAPAVPLEHPLDLLWNGASHGGLWRHPNAPRTVLPAAVILGAPALLGRG